MKIEPKPPFKPNANSQEAEPTAELLTLSNKIKKSFKRVSKEFKVFKRILKGFFKRRKMQQLEPDENSAEITKLISSRLKLLA